jgi:hypothetical protein
VNSARNISPHTSASVESLVPVQPGNSLNISSSLPGLVSAAVPLEMGALDADASLGLASNNFAELYGLTSDMEPILMVCSQVHKNIQVLNS